jgi:hypothetical protein
MILRILAILWCLLPVALLVLIVIDHASGSATTQSVNDIVPAYLS